MKELQTKFVGAGEVKGYLFNQMSFCVVDKQLNGVDQGAYLYSVISPTGVTMYEVFERKYNTRFKTISYPRSGAFGIWAWCYRNYDEAKRKFDWLLQNLEI